MWFFKVKNFVMADKFKMSAVSAFFIGKSPWCMPWLSQIYKILYKHTYITIQKKKKSIHILLVGILNYDVHYNNMRLRAKYIQLSATIEEDSLMSILFCSGPFQPERARFGKIRNEMGTLKISDPISGRSGRNQVVPAGMDGIVQFRPERISLYFVKLFP